MRDALIPRSTDRGSIEGSYSWLVTRPAMTIPRSTDRGSIEGMIRLGAVVRIRREFRDQLIAAPLKVEPLLEERQVLRQFRDQLIAAPLKVTKTAARSASSLPIPRSTDRGSIEGRRC